MRTIILFLIPFIVWAKCEQLEKAADMLDMKKFIKSNMDSRAIKVEPSVVLADVNQARNFTYKFPALHEFGFGSPSKSLNSGWKTYSSRMSKSAFYNKVVGWEKKLPNGSTARIRLDFEPIAGTNKGVAHYNIELMKVPHNGKLENFNLKVEFKCPSGNCTEAEVLSMVNKLN